jgi:hypothetical protein
MLGRDAAWPADGYRPELSGGKEPIDGFRQSSIVDIAAENQFVGHGDQFPARFLAAGFEKSKKLKSWRPRRIVFNRMDGIGPS